MANEIIPYLEMCQREETSLQRGMNYGLGGTHSVILMSLRANAPYRDRLEENGSILIYEGHDEPKSANAQDPKTLDQPQFTSKGRLLKTVTSMRLHKLIREVRGYLSECACTRKSSTAFGRITVFFI
jgi:hypothetical protein